MNLELYNKLRTVPSIAKKPITGGRLSGMTDINPMWRIKKLTEEFGACGIGWYYERLDKWTEKSEETGEVGAFVEINLYVKQDGEWSKPIYGNGGAMFVSNERKGKYTNDEAFKMATTDAISVACKQLGMGADVYWDKDNTKYNDQKIENAVSENGVVNDKPITEEHINELTKRARSIGLRFDPKVYEKEKVEDLTEGEFSRAMQTLDTLEQRITQK